MTRTSTYDEPLPLIMLERHERSVLVRLIRFGVVMEWRG